MTFTQLEVFAALARAGSFSRAAALLGITQSAVSHAVRGLEAELGVALMVREGAQSTLSEAGSRLLEAGWPLQHVQAVLGHAEASTTSRYLNATDEHLLDSMQRFGVQPLHSVAQPSDQEPPPPVQPDSATAGNVLVN